MYVYRLKWSTSKLKRNLLCLAVSMITYFVVLYLNRHEEPDSCFPKDLTKLLSIDRKLLGINTSVEVKPLRAHLETLNKEREVRNVKDFGPVSADTLYLVVRVRRAPATLRLLLAALERVPGVDNLLLVFSHAYYDPVINQLVQQIDFCMVLQIFYLSSVQLHPFSFSGYDPEYSTKNSVGRGRRKRDPRLTEGKHHWWWTAHYVFERLAWPEPLTGMAIFIDDSSYVLPDMLFMFAAAQDAMRYFPDADVISLGRSPESDTDYDKLTLEPWRAVLGNGLAFNASTWRKISDLRKLYCEYDDTRWSRSLQHLFSRLPAGRALALAARAPRVLTMSSAVEPRALRHLCWLSTRPRLFPRKVQAVVLYGRAGMVLPSPGPLPEGNGGWSDRRDFSRCCEVFRLEENVTTFLKPRPR